MDQTEPLTHAALGRLMEHRDGLARQVADEVVAGRMPATYKVASYAAAKAQVDWELARDGAA